MPTNIPPYPILSSECDDAYFGKNPTIERKAGYTDYYRTQNYNRSAGYGFTLEESSGNYFQDMIKSIDFRASGVLVGKSCLILGDPFGFETEAMRAIGVDAVGIDIYPNAAAQAAIYAPGAVGFLTGGIDVRTYLPTLARNAYDYIYSRLLLSFFDDTELLALIAQMDRVSKSGMMHVVNPNANLEYYYTRTWAEWQTFGWSRTILINMTDYANAVQF